MNISFKLFDGDDEPEFIGLTHPSEFPIRHKMFMDWAAQASKTGWHNSLMWDEGDQGCPTLLVGSEKRPRVARWDWTRDKQSYVMRVPVKAACEAVCVFPNGYFSDDIQPEDNYHLAKVLEDKFGLEIFGFGATYVGYMRKSPFTPDEAVALGACLSPLYASEPKNVGAKIAAIVEGEHTLFLAYGNR